MTRHFAPFLHLSFIGNGSKGNGPRTLESRKTGEVKMGSLMFGEERDRIEEEGDE